MFWPSWFFTVQHLGDTDAQEVCVTVLLPSATCFAPLFLGVTKSFVKNGVFYRHSANARSLPGLVKGPFWATKAQFRPYIRVFWENAWPYLGGQKTASISRDKVFFHRHAFLSFPQVNGQIAMSMNRDKVFFLSTFFEAVSTLFFVPVAAGGEVYA